MNASKPGQGILASLEHKSTKQTAMHAASALAAAGRMSAVISTASLVAVALLGWWLYSSPSPVVMPDPPLPPLQVSARAPVAEPSLANEAAAIIDVPAPAPLDGPAPAAVFLPRKESHFTARVPAKPVRRPHATPAARPRAVPDSDVALLTALVAHTHTYDVVEPRLADRTEGLLQRCAQVGGEEGRLCRLRICASRGGDIACDTD